MSHRTRLAPSPTGALHLGNARTFLVNWAMARQQGWEILLRIEDLDGPRVKPGAAEEAIELLQWLGLDWDQGPLFQTHDLEPYRAALEQLAAEGATYPCNCTRREIEAASRSAPQEGDHELLYPGTCRPAKPVAIAPANVEFQECGWRFRVESTETPFVDEMVGEVDLSVARTVGDFQVWTKGGLPSYQLAVVVDDARQGIDQIVRGNDLIASTPRQLMIARALQLDYAPQFWHLPLVRGDDGKRLAKRHGDTRLARYRQRGGAPERMIGLLAEWCGCGPRREMTAAEFVAKFAIDRLPPGDVVYHAEDNVWLAG